MLHCTTRTTCTLTKIILICTHNCRVHNYHSVLNNILSADAIIKFTMEPDDKLENIISPTSDFYLLIDAYAIHLNWARYVYNHMLGLKTDFTMQ